MFKKKYDVVVIGAGPAGSSAAESAAKRGLEVLLIEKRAEVGVPVRCAEGIGREGLETLGIRPMPEWTSNEVKGAKIVAPNGCSVTLEAKMAGNEVGIIVHRDKFDQYLASRAVDSGADLYTRSAAIGISRKGEEVAVRIRHFGEVQEVRTNVVIGADGFESHVGEWFGLRTRIAPKDIDSTFEYRIVGGEFDEDYTEFFLGNEIAPGGYIWVFPKGDNVANVGIGVLVSKIKGKEQMPKFLLDKFLKTHPEYRGKIIGMYAGAVSVSKPLTPSYSDNLMLVGDAARMIDPLTGGGIINAIVSGRCAGEVAVNAYEREDFSANSLKEYEEKWKKKLYEKLIRNYWAKEILIQISDDVLNKAADALKDYEFKHINTYEILKAVERRHPEILKELEKFL